MNPPAVIVDTNVVVAGLLAADDASPVARILDGMLAAAFPFVVSEALLVDIAQHAIVLVPVATSSAPDPWDQLLWELLAARAGLLLVTGDKPLRRDARMRARVMSPRTFVEGA